MLHFAKWKIALISAICLVGLAYSVPSFLTSRALEVFPSWLPIKKVTLGLDLQGGSHLLLEVDVKAVIVERLNNMVDSARTALRQERIGYTNLGTHDGAMTVTLRDAADADKARNALRNLEPDLDVQVAGTGLAVRYTEVALRDRKRSVIEQSVEIIRRRVDETGTREPTIQRQGDDRILVQLPGVDDPERIKNLLGKTAKMQFRMVDATVTEADIAAGRVPPGSEILSAEEGGTRRGQGGRYAVQKRVMVSGETLTDAQPTFQNGEPVVSFRFDSVGARRFGEATRQNVGKPFAIVLDGKVISAPVIREAILGGSGIISGSFTTQSAQDLALLLRAGALPAPLNVIEERTVGPDLGADSIRAGAIACAIGFALIGLLMVVGYGLFGMIANAGLILNIAFTLSIMAALGGTLTLPGIAGMVLGLAMAVDANVLIYERMREETDQGRSPLSASEMAFSRAYVTIIDSNLTTLIAALILYALGSGPVRGFAVTLSIAIACSMFTAVTFCRMMVATWLMRSRPKTLPI